MQFGNGEHGTRLPTGIENVKATYRTGLGIAGNVQPGQINQLPSPPSGVKTTTNPLRADGGADADTLEQTRLRVPALPASMDRLVSKRDYENFALRFAGVDKVSVQENAGQFSMCVAGITPAPLAEFVAGTTPDPLAGKGQLLLNLSRAFELIGAEVTVKPHKGLLLHIRAGVRIDARYEWEPVEAAIKLALIKRFGYAAMNLGQEVLASEVIQVIQSVKNVNYAILQELVALATDTERKLDPTARRSSSSSQNGNQVAVARVTVFSNEVCYIDDIVSSSVQLEPIT